MLHRIEWYVSANLHNELAKLWQAKSQTRPSETAGRARAGVEGPSLLRMGKHAGESDEIPDTPTPVVWFTRGVSQYTFCMNDIPMAMGVWLLCLCLSSMLGTSVKNSKYSYSAETRLFG